MVRKRTDNRLPYHFLIIIPAFLIFQLFGCNDGGKDPAHIALKHVIIQYNKFLSEGYRTLDMKGLLEIATKERAEKAFRHMSALGEARIKMDSRIIEISFSDISLLPDSRAEVRTHERWEYKHINIDSNSIERHRIADYDIKYTLVKTNNRWLVSGASLLNSDESDILTDK